MDPVENNHTTHQKLIPQHKKLEKMFNYICDYTSRKDLSIFLSQGGDFTWKTKHDLTILHLILRTQPTNDFRFSNLTSILDNTCVNMILSAHVETRNPTNPCDDNGMTHFHIACMANHVEAIEFFLENNISVNHSINSNSAYFAGFAPLHLAIRCCNLKITRVLLNYGASIHLKNAKGQTSLHMVMENFLKFSNDSPLGFFGSSDLPKKLVNEEIANLLLEMVSNNKTMIIDELGLSCLHLACTMMDTSIAEKLLIRGDINQSIKFESPIWPGYTALHFAAHVNTNTVEMLVKNGADLTAMDAYGRTPIDLCMETYKAEDIHAVLSMNLLYKEIKFTRRITLLSFILAMRDCKQFIAFLNKYSNSTRITVPINAPLWPGYTPFHLLVLFSSLGNFYISHDEEKDFSPSEKIHKNNEKHEALIVRKQYLQMMTDLNGKNVNLITARDIHDRTPLHLCFRLVKSRKVIDLLLKLHNNISSPVDLVDDEDLSLLHVACSRDYKGIVEKLISNSKNVGLAYKGKAILNVIETGWTPLHVAVANNNVNVVKILLTHGADVHSKDVNGVTPIHLLFLRGSKEAAFLLSVRNLKESVVEGIGLSHLHVACFMQKADAVKKLLDGGSNVNLAITSNKKLAEKSFELLKLIEYLGCTPLQLSKPRLNYFFYDCTHQKESKTIDLLTTHRADIFVSDSRRIPFVLENLRYFYEHLKGNAHLQRMAEDKIGLTRVHMACFYGDMVWLKSLLAEGANVNGRLSANLSAKKCAGFTPLHVIMKNNYGFKDEVKSEFIKLLLDGGADITISNAKQQTPLHKAHKCYQNVIMMLKAQKDFSINPTNDEGISHFHIACRVCETDIVKKFLERGDVDVNLSTDSISKREKYSEAGFTPLHMAACYNIEVTSQLQTVDLLMNHGADTNYQNTLGNSALHITNRYEIFERICRGGADVNLLNKDGHTPLGSLLTERIHAYDRVTASAKEILNWMRCGCYYNAFNNHTEEGYIGKSINVIPFQELQKLIKIAAVNMPDALRVDAIGRTAIHNVATCEGYHSRYMGEDDRDISIVQYASLIETLASTGCDIDSPDNLGRTALHLATKFDHSKAISALLMVGADVNIPDGNGKTALAYHIGACESCSTLDLDVYKKCKVFKVLAVHVQKLQLCHLEVCPSNRCYVTDDFISTIEYERFDSELEEMKKLEIQTYPLTLKSFLSEIDVLADYPTMSLPKKDAIDEFFHQDKISHFREKFGEVAGLLSLQYRKAINRGPLMEDATTSLDFFAKFPVPELCSRIILGFLSNSDLKHFIAATNNCKVGEQGSQIDVLEESLSKHKKLRI